MQRDEIGKQLIARDLLAGAYGERHRRIGLDRSDTVDARHRRDDDDVIALEQRARRGVTHAVDLFVDRRFLLDVRVGARDVGFRLVVVVIGNEILDGVVRKETLELAVELRRQRLVRRQDQRRTLCRLNDVRHRERLARAGDAEQHLIVLVLRDAIDEFGDRLWLVAPRLVIGFDFEPDAAFAFFRTLRTMRHEHRHAAGDDRMRRHQGLARENFFRAFGAFVRPCQQCGQTVGQAFAAHRRTRPRCA